MKLIVRMRHPPLGPRRKVVVQTSQFDQAESTEQQVIHMRGLQGLQVEHGDASGRNLWRD